MAGERTFLYLDVAFKVGFWSGTTAPTQFLATPINFTKLELSPPKQEIKRITSNIEGSIGQALATVQRATGEPGQLAGEFDAAPRDLIALALGATVADLAISTLEVTAEPVTTILDVWVPLANAWLDPTSVVLKTGAAVVAADKYAVDEVNGLIMALHADAVGSKTVDYDVLATTGSSYSAGQALSSYVSLVGTCTEQTTKTRGRVVIYKANLAADGSFDLVGGGALKGSLKGDLETPTGRASPWLYQASARASAY
ncbi:MAG: hypothetical protein RLZZ524_1389 [Pseudomonadota bacterium]|jgi:hypothetical protein